MSLEIGVPAPEFNTVDAEGKPYSLAEFRNSFVVIFFYPGDETPGCTIEACSFRDQYSLFPAHHAVVLGVSEDTAESHQHFATHHNLQFPLLVDTDHAISNAYEAYGEKSFYGHKSIGVKRMTYLIGPDGNIAFIWKKVRPLGHAEEVLAKIAELQSA